MEEETAPGELSSFCDTGIYRLAANSTAVFMEPVRVLSKSYTRHTLRPSSYYSRSFRPAGRGGEGAGAAVGGGGEGDEQASASPCAPKKRKRKKKKKEGKSRDLNERERAAEQRHQEARPFLLKAHEYFLRATELLSALPAIVEDERPPEVEGETSEINFIELGSLWQASHYEISLCFPPQGEMSGVQGTQPGSGLCCATVVMPLFNNSICNETDDDLEAVFLNNKYILPRRSCFYMVAHSDYGFNLIVVDPPWENASACQKSFFIKILCDTEPHSFVLCVNELSCLQVVKWDERYPTLPSRYFLYIPVRQLAHTQGALVALWVTNKEKLRTFVEEELFPAWGVTNVTVFYWLKVKTDGSMIGDLDLFHHRPYECLLLGYVNGKGADSRHDTTCRIPESDGVIITIPSAYSRKPPLGTFLLDYIPGPRPANCIELFARELIPGWTSWGNEPLHFQDSRYFMDKIT